MRLKTGKMSLIRNARLTPICLRFSWTFHSWIFFHKLFEKKTFWWNDIVLYIEIYLLTKICFVYGTYCVNVCYVYIIYRYMNINILLITLVNRDKCKYSTLLQNGGNSSLWYGRKSKKRCYLNVLTVSPYY